MDFSSKVQCSTCKQYFYENKMYSCSDCNHHFCEEHRTKISHNCSSFINSIEEDEKKGKEKDSIKNEKNKVFFSVKDQFEKVEKRFDGDDYFDTGSNSGKNHFQVKTASSFTNRSEKDLKFNGIIKYFLPLLFLYCLFCFVLLVYILINFYHIICSYTIISLCHNIYKYNIIKSLTRKVVKIESHEQEHFKR